MPIQNDSREREREIKRERERERQTDRQTDRKIEKKREKIQIIFQFMENKRCELLIQVFFKMKTFS